jgi:hypothetical protein
MTSPPTVRLASDAIVLHGLEIRFHRTLRVPGDGGVYALPPSLGTFPLHRVDDFPATAPAHWRERGGVFFCMRRREAMWMSFSAPAPVAVKVAVGGVNAITGDPWREDIDEDQDYMVAPPQPWLDGIVGDDDAVSQFVAMPLGSGYTVEGQITARETLGGIQIGACPARPGAIPPPMSFAHFAAPSEILVHERAAAPPADMGIAAGGAIRQHVYDDPYGPGAWDQDALARCLVHMVDPAGYRAITGVEPPPTPVGYEDYVRAGLPWFDVYDEGMPSRPGSETLGGVTTVDALDAEAREGAGPAGRGD